MAKETIQTCLKLSGDWRVEPNERTLDNHIRSWKVLDRAGKRFITTKTKTDALKLAAFMMQHGH